MQPPPSDHRYRRRFLVEFTPAESDQLDRLGFAHGTKRRAILDGLQLLETGEVEALRAQVATLTAEREAARAAATRVSEAGTASAKEQRAKASATSAKLIDERAAHKETRTQLAQARQDLKNAKQSLANAEAEKRRLAALIPHHAFCPSCDVYVPETEWAEAPDNKGGIHVYHKAHDPIAKRSWNQKPSLLFWRPAPSAPKAAS